MPDQVVATAAGKVRGVEEAGLLVFRGLRYATLAAGGRLAPPAPVEPWSGVREAVEYGPIAPQPPQDPSTGVPGDPSDWDEDCLSLNIWAPVRSEEQPPVMVFVHGGGFIGGSGAGQLYRGEQLARRGGVVVVTINYRLGALGFLAHPSLSLSGVPGHGNWGLQDIVAALHWVHDNIAAFGGDPRRVTLFGESAGSIAVAALLGAPSAAGLFRRAILQSGPAVARSSKSAAAVAERVAANLGMDEVDRDRLSKVPVADLLAAQSAVVGSIAGEDGLAFQPTVDGGLLTTHPADAIAAGSGADVDVLIGTNRDEFKFFVVAIPELGVVDEAELHRRVGRSMHAAGLGRQVQAQAIVEAYVAARSARGESVAAPELFSAMATDWLFRVPSIRLAEARSPVGSGTYMYLFDWQSPFGGGLLGACHALELPFVFGTYHHPVISLFSGSGPEAAALSEAMQDAWVCLRPNRQPVDGQPRMARLRPAAAGDDAPRGHLRRGGGAPRGRACGVEPIPRPVRAQRSCRGRRRVPRHT